MTTDFLKFIMPHIVTTQVIASGRDANIEDIFRFCKGEGVTGSTALYKTISDLFSIYETDAPTDIYSVTPNVLNMYARVYAKYVLKRQIVLFDDVLEWNRIIKDMHANQNGRPYRMFCELIRLNAFGDDTIEIVTFIANTLALVFNYQQVLLNKSVFRALKTYTEHEEWQAIDELVMFYVRYREFLSTEYAFAYYIYSATVQYGYADPQAPDGSISYMYKIGNYQAKAKYNSGSGDWLLTVYDKNRAPIGSVSYVDVVTKCRNTGNITPEILATMWYQLPDNFTRNVPFDISRFGKIFKYVLEHGRRHPLVIKHLRDNYSWNTGEYSVIIYKTSWSNVIYLRRGTTLVGVIESGNGRCYASSEEVIKEITSIRLIDGNTQYTLVDVLCDYISSKHKGEPSIRTVVTSVIDVLQQYDVRGLDYIRESLSESKI